MNQVQAKLQGGEGDPPTAPGDGSESYCEGSQFIVPFTPQEPEGGELFETLPGAVLRKARGVKPYVWVRNCSKETIVVEVSEHRPRRIGTAVGMTGGAVGGGLSVGASLYDRKSTKLPIPPKDERSCPVMSFPILWRMEYALVSIYKDQGEKPFIQNRQLRIGELMEYNGTEKLRVFSHDGKEKAAPSPSKSTPFVEGLSSSDNERPSAIPQEQVKEITAEPSEQTNSQLKPATLTSGLISLGRVEQTLEMEEWEISPGKVPLDTSSNVSNAVYSTRYTNKDIKVTDRVTFCVHTVKPGTSIQWDPESAKLRVYSVATGKVKAQIQGKEFAIGPNGLLYTGVNMGCSFENRFYIDAVIHVTSIEGDQS